MDRLGELTWLAPISVLVFGVLGSLVVLAYRPEKLDRWMLLLIVGTFAGAYPLMYFAQEFVPLPAAIALAGALVLVVIGGRAVTLFGPRMGLVGIVLPAAAILAVTVLSAVRPELQGVLLTVETILTFVTAMVLLPRSQRALAAMSPGLVPAPPPAAGSR